MKVKRLLAFFSMATMAGTLLIGCGGSGNASTSAQETPAETTSSSSEAATDTASDLAGTEITFLNSKGEIQTALEDMAKKFEEESGIKVEILACGTGESPYTKITSAYNAGTAPTMAMLDTTDVVALADEYAVDLSDEKWVGECENQLTKISDKVYCFPFCIEGRGLIYNKAAIEKTLGKEFDPSTINSYDSLKALLESLKAGGMDKPVVLSKEDWSLGNHQLGFIYDTYDGTTEGSSKLIGQLEDGSLKTADYERFNQFVDTFDLLAEYNINGADPLGALYDQDPIFLVDGKAAIWANGCWAWPNLEEAGASTSDEYGFLPFTLGNDTADFANNGIQASASKQVMIDNEQASKEQIAAAKEFLNWMVYSESGQKMLVDTAAIIPACKNNTNEALNPLAKDIQSKMASGNTYSSSFIAPGDHWSVLGASMQKYLAGNTDKAGLATEIDKYWTSQKQ